MTFAFMCFICLFIYFCPLSQSLLNGKGEEEEGGCERAQRVPPWLASCDNYLAHLVESWLLIGETNAATRILIMHPVVEVLRRGDSVTHYSSSLFSAYFLYCFLLFVFTLPVSVTSVSLTSDEATLDSDSVLIFCWMSLSNVTQAWWQRCLILMSCIHKT